MDGHRISLVQKLNTETRARRALFDKEPSERFSDGVPVSAGGGQADRVSFSKTGSPPWISMPEAWTSA